MSRMAVISKMFNHVFAARLGFEINIYSLVERQNSFSYILNVAVLTG